MKKIIALIMTLLILLSCFPSIVQAEGDALIEIIKKDVPIRNKPYQEGEIIARCKKGAVLQYTDIKINSRFRRWYVVDWGGKTGYIYSENVELHHHHYDSVTTISSITFKICNECGDCYAVGSSAEKKKGDELLSFVSLPAIGTLCAVDGPLPIGDIVALFIGVVAIATYFDTTVPTNASFAELVTESDILSQMMIKKTICTSDNFHVVERVPGGLKYLSPYCLDYLEAFAVAKALNMDIYTESEVAAQNLALLYNGSLIGERDKDQMTHFYHYHFGTDRKVKAHVFFGLNDYGQGPMY